MSSSLSDIRDGLVEVLSSAMPDVQVNRLPVDTVDPPAVIVAGMQGQPQVMSVTGQVVTVDLFVVVSRRSVDEVDTLDRLVDETRPDSVIAAIHDDHTLGGRVMSVRVVNFGEYREMEVGGVPYYAATVTVEVLT